MMCHFQGLESVKKWRIQLRSMKVCEFWLLLSHWKAISPWFWKRLARELHTSGWRASYLGWCRLWSWNSYALSSELWNEGCTCVTFKKKWRSVIHQILSLNLGKKRSWKFMNFGVKICRNCVRVVLFNAIVGNQIRMFVFLSKYMNVTLQCSLTVTHRTARSEPALRRRHVVCRAACGSC